MISIVICTHNRAALLRDALKSYSEMHELQDVVHELIVIDNKSSDNTRKVVDEFTNNKSVRYVLEDELGLSYARNRGIRESSGEVIAFVDDDIIFSERWLVELEQGAKKWTDAAVYGGKTLPKWEMAKPLWFIDDGFFEMRGTVGHFEPNIPEGYMSQFPWGCNMAFRRSILETLKFDGELGRKGGMLLSSEEWDLFYEIRRMGGKFVYLPKAMVIHRITQERGERKYYIKRTQTHMKSVVYMYQKHNLKKKHILGIPVGSVKMLIKIMIKIFKDISKFRDTNRIFSYKITVLRELYYIKLFRENIQLSRKLQLKSKLTP